MDMAAETMERAFRRDQIAGLAGERAPSLTARLKSIGACDTASSSAQNETVH
jgi:hypothetical protein